MSNHAFTVIIDEIYDPHRQGVDLGRLIESSERKRRVLAVSARPLLPTTTTEEALVPSFLSGLVGSRTGIKNALVPYLSAMKSDRLAVSAQSLSLPQEKSPKRHALTVPKPNRFQVNKAEGHVSRALGQVDLRDSGTQEITLPFFASPLIRAIELKSLCGQPDDLLLRFEGTRWQIVEDDELVDLRNRTQTYRLGPIQVYS